METLSHVVVHIEVAKVAAATLQKLKSIEYGDTCDTDVTAVLQVTTKTTEGEVSQYAQNGVGTRLF
jgi:hypothetical protein